MTSIKNVFESGDGSGSEEKFIAFLKASELKYQESPSDGYNSITVSLPGPKKLTVRFDFEDGEFMQAEVV